MFGSRDPLLARKDFLLLREGLLRRGLEILSEREEDGKDGLGGRAEERGHVKVTSLEKPSVHNYVSSSLDHEANKDSASGGVEQCCAVSFQPRPAKRARSSVGGSVSLICVIPTSISGKLPCYATRSATSYFSSSPSFFSSSSSSPSFSIACFSTSR